jgi:hypothetical protein
MSQNCKLVEDIPQRIYKGKDGIVLVSEIRYRERISLIKEDIFQLFLKNYSYEESDWGKIKRYILILKRY